MHVFIIVVLTADGFIAEETNDISTRWTSKEDIRFFVKRTKEAGAMVMGSTTFQTIGKPLPGRKIYIYTRHPQDFAGYDPAEIEAVSLDPAEMVKKAEADGYQELAICGGASIYTQFMNAGVVDTLYITYEPALFGQGVSLFTEPVQKKLQLVSTQSLSEQTTLVEYSVIKES